MSLTIYNGYKLPLMDILTLNQQLQSLREQTKIVNKRIYTDLLARQFTRMIDDLPFLTEQKIVKEYINLNNEEVCNVEQSFRRLPLTVFNFQNILEYEESKRKKLNNPLVNFDSKIVYIPLEDKILGLLYTSQNEIIKMWEQIENVTYYGYWNNTDKDENCLTDEWLQRELDWEKALPRYEEPSEVGVTVQLSKGLPNLQGIKLEEIITSIPSFNDRLERVSTQQILDKKIRELENKDSSSYGLHKKATKWLTTEEGIKELERTKNKNKDKLLPIIRKEHLGMTFKTLKKELKKQQ